MISKFKNSFKLFVVFSMMFFSGTGIAASQILPVDTMSPCHAYEVFEPHPAFICGGPYVCQPAFER